MLLLLHRLVCSRERGVPAARERAQVLAPLLTVPAVLDAAALYGAVGGQQLQELLESSFCLQPKLITELTRAASTIANNTGQVAEACQGAVGGVAAGDEGMLRSLRDGVLYLRDACLTLCALVRARPAAAGALLADGPGLIEALGAVHDQLLPAAATALGPRPAAAPLLALCHQVELGAERLVQLLILHGYLDEVAAAGAGAGSSVATASSSSGSSSHGAAVARGEALLHAVMAMGHREEASGTAGSGLGLGPALAERYGLGSSIEAALHAGRISLDEAQLDYLAALLDVASLVAAPGPAPGAAGIDITGGAAGDSGPAAGAGAEDAALLLSRIQQVRELLPDYGEGFVAACLDALGGSAERVLDALLEGSPPAAASDLDPGLGLPAYQAKQRRQGSTAGAGAMDKGKRPMEAELPPPAGPTGPPTADALWQPSSRAETAPQQLQQRIESNTAKFLDIREEGYQQSLLSTATAMQARPGSAAAAAARVLPDHPAALCCHT